MLLMETQVYCDEMKEMEMKEMFIGDEALVKGLAGV
jgi:hypothetical protein